MFSISHKTIRKIKKATKVLVLASSIFAIIFAVINLPYLKDKFLENEFLGLKPEPKISTEKAARLEVLYMAAGKKYDMPWEYLKAINKVETNFGQNPGRYRVLDVIRTSERDEFYQICSEKGINPSSVKGSKAGAIGFMQFMPSTWQKYKDASGNPPYDPWDEEDSIFAAAKLLAENGGKEEIYRAIWNYNPDPDYVDEVTRLAELYSKNSANNKGLRAAAKSASFDADEAIISEEKYLNSTNIPNLADAPKIKPSDIKINWWFDKQLDFGRLYKSVGPPYRTILLSFVLFIDEFQNNTTEVVKTNLVSFIDKIEEKF